MKKTFLVFQEGKSKKKCKFISESLIQRKQILLKTERTAFITHERLNLENSDNKKLHTRFHAQSVSMAADLSAIVPKTLSKQIWYFKAFLVVPFSCARSPSVKCVFLFECSRCVGRLFKAKSRNGIIYLVLNAVSADDAENDNGDASVCGKILIFLSWCLVVITMPMSLIVCFKVSEHLHPAAPN